MSFIEGSISIAEASLCEQAPKRGLSVEEKRQKIQQIFHESQDVFQLKVGTPSLLQPSRTSHGGHFWSEADRLRRRMASEALYSTCASLPPA